ncbi:hypothetical protein OUZ56_010135 [Daphnia magna]|uniref:USP domain-containing protein n=1 Tax=Daphnia magna TaxID=35525 RepID=A0ABR0AHZ9_9CRUS|nr:hypothetical protein OUZ56_010135 [Daphnia magna]
MDQTYLDDLLQIPHLKSQDAASLKIFANRLHGAVDAHELHSRTTLMAIEAKLTSYLKEKWNENKKKVGVELNILDLDDLVTVKYMSKQHGKNVFESFPTLTSKAVRLDEKKPVKRQNATLISTIGHVSTAEGSKITASSLPSAAPHGRRLKTTDHWRCRACNGRTHNLASFVLLVDELEPDTIPCFTDQNSFHEETIELSDSISACIDCIPLDTKPEGNASVQNGSTLSDSWKPEVTTLIKSDVPKRIIVVSYDGATSIVQASVVNFSLSSVDGTSKFEVRHAYAVDNLKVTPNPLINCHQMESLTHLRGLDVLNFQPQMLLYYLDSTSQRPTTTYLPLSRRLEQLDQSASKHQFNYGMFRSY